MGLKEALTEEAYILGSLDEEGRRVGVVALDVGLEGGKVGLLVGVEDLAADLDKGVEDLDGIVGLVAGTRVSVAEAKCLVAETAGLMVEVVVLDVTMDLVGVEGLDDFEDVVNVGVKGLDDFEDDDFEDVVNVGVEGLDDLEDVVNVGRPVGVAGRDPGPPDDEGLLVPPLEELNPGEEVGCLDTKLVLPAGSD